MCVVAYNTHGNIGGGVTGLEPREVVTKEGERGRETPRQAGDTPGTQQAKHRFSLSS